MKARHRSTWSIRPRAIIALAVACVGLAGAVYLTGQSDVASAAEHRPVFDDDFQGERGTDLDRSKWLLDGDNHNARLDGEGNLIVDRLISTRQAFAEPFGHAEARVKVRRVNGPWRAFSAVDKYGRVLRGKVEKLDGDAATGDDFHTYAIDWTPETVVWSVDGQPSLKLTPDEPGLPIALVLNLATDGQRPARMVVDFVRVTAGEKPQPMPTVSSSAPPAPAAPPWKVRTSYAPGDLVTFKGATYRVKEAHTALPGWEPSALPNLFTKV
ncbi:carbohydrate-binding protein [Actinoplanes solisilvae]|uniref:carbohydrate-binding protein n=1 Tax=Actinoplanes solisilvae TaxID=2486853 RepID=UPI0013E2B2B6|nr:carbohydrate-binding protein [Actinoplanes solisilvae]